MHTYKDSLVLRLILGIIVLILISFSVMIGNYVYAIHVVKSNLITSKDNTLNVYINNMDNILGNAVSDLDAIVAGTDDFSLLNSENESTRYFTAKAVLDTLNNRINSNRTSDALIVYNEETDLYLSAYSKRMNQWNKQDLMDLIKSPDISRQKRNAPWSVIRYEDSVFFCKTYVLSSAKLVAVIAPETLMSLVDTTSSQTEAYVLAQPDGTPILVEGNQNYVKEGIKLPIHVPVQDNFEDQYMVITKSMSRSQALLSILVKENRILVGLSLMQWMIILLGSLTLLLMPMIAYYLNREIIRPINMLVRGIEEIESGNLEHQVEIREKSREFVRLTRTFNSMVREIKNLKITHYEEKLELQKAELKYLQNQLKPHFFLNAITTVHSLTYKNNNELIRNYIDAFIMHFRYILRASLSEVTLRDEVSHVKNYIAMQEIRFPGSVFYIVDMSPEVEGMRIPQLLILTIVENAFKHAMTLDVALSLLIKIEEEEKSNMLHIIVEDNGEGFDASTLKRVNDDAQELSKDGSRIGLINVKKTLELLYPGKGRLTIGNTKPNGARIEMWIPMEVNVDETVYH